MTAIDLNTGEFRWRKSFGEHPELTDPANVESIVLQTSNASGYFARMGFTPISYAELAPAVLASPAMRRDQVEVGTLMQIAL